MARGFSFLPRPLPLPITPSDVVLNSFIRPCPSERSMILLLSTLRDWGCTVYRKPWLKGVRARILASSPLTFFLVPSPSSFSAASSICLKPPPAPNTSCTPSAPLLLTALAYFCTTACCTSEWWSAAAASRTSVLLLKMGLLHLSISSFSSRLFAGVSILCFRSATMVTPIGAFSPSLRFRYSGVHGSCSSSSYMAVRIDMAGKVCASLGSIQSLMLKRMFRSMSTFCSGLIESTVLTFSSICILWIAGCCALTHSLSALTALTIIFCSLSTITSFSTSDCCFDFTLFIPASVCDSGSWSLRLMPELRWGPAGPALPFFFLREGS
mmetsp:Transcript_18401/g.40934  ORF Transcript_18401/g.40934 Transcript_18401/m.40934 type:complete len:325 (+) Transcript_18401:164-1138(+)